MASHVQNDTAKGGNLAKGFLIEGHSATDPESEKGSLVHAGKATYGGIQEASGGWLEASIHFLTQVSTFPNLIMPFILASIGWGPGIPVAVVIFATVVYCSYLMADINVIDGVRYNRYRDLAQAVWGYPGYCALVFLDVLLVLGVMIGSILSGGILLKSIVLLYNPNTSVTLAEFIIIVGAAVLLMSLLPTLHDLRWFNAFAATLVFVYCIITGGLCINAAVKGLGVKDYSVIWGSISNRAFTCLNAVVLFGSVPVNPMMPEAQATLKDPRKDMRKALNFSWPLVFLEIFIIAIPGYLAFGNAAGNPNLTYILQIFTTNRAAVAVALAMAVLNICIMANLFGQPLYELMEGYINDNSKGPFHLRNFAVRAVCRGAWVCLFVFIAALIPFFSSIQGLVSALTYLPMDVIIPLVLYQHVRKPAGFWKVFHYGLAAIYTLFCIGGAVSSLRGIIVSASTFKVFANL